jgi:hypothetical protein
LPLMVAPATGNGIGDDLEMCRLEFLESRIIL